MSGLIKMSQKLTIKSLTLPKMLMKMKINSIKLTMKRLTMLKKKTLNWLLALQLWLRGILTQEYQRHLL